MGAAPAPANIRTWSQSVTATPWAKPSGQRKYRRRLVIGLAIVCVALGLAVSAWPEEGQPGLRQNRSQDPSSFGWVRAGAMVPFSWQGNNFGEVAAGTERLWTAMLDELVPAIPGGLTNELGCYQNRRNANNPGVWSFHSYGLACDINYGDNPNGAAGYGRSGLHVIPGEVATDIAAKYCMLWGGDFRGVTDPMHFEIHVTPAQISVWLAGAGAAAAAGPGG